MILCDREKDRGNKDNFTLVSFLNFGRKFTTFAITTKDTFSMSMNYQQKDGGISLTNFSK